MQPATVLYSTFSSEAIKQLVLSHVGNSAEEGISFQSDGYFEYLVTFCEHIESEQLHQ